MRKNTLLFFISISFFSLAQTYPSLNISLLGQLDPETVVNTWFSPSSATKYAGVIGWVDPQDNKEYAILGSTTGYYFIDVSNPTAPVVRDFESGINTNALWREMKTYGNYCYMVSDDALPNGLIIADLSYLPDSVHIVHKGNTILNRSHTVFVDGNKLYCGYVNIPSVGQRSMAVYDLSNPASPTLLRILNQDYTNIGSVHDMWVQNDTVFASCGNDGLHIYKFNANNTFTEIGSYTGYIQAGYNHSSYRTADKKTLVFCDEVPTNTVIKILDVSDFSNFTLLDTIKSNQGATPHNPYILGNDFAVVSYYQDGLYIFNIQDPSNVSVAGYFDTHPQNGANNNYPSSPTSYMGAWGADPFLPSGHILVSDMQNGLFILDASAAVGVKENKEKSSMSLSLFPNPAQSELTLQIFNCNDDATVFIYDLHGKKVAEEKISGNSIISGLSFDTSKLSSGFYEVVLKTEKNLLVKKFVKE